MKPGVGPVFDQPLVVPADMEKLVFPDVKTVLKYVFDAISLTRHKLEGQVPLIGFTGAPWTLMSYMIEGGGSKTLSKAKKWLYQHPDASRKLLKIITDVNVEYLVEQVRAGAQLLQVFESNAEYLGAREFKEFALPTLVDINKRVKERLAGEGLEVVPMTVFAKVISPIYFGTFSAPRSFWPVSRTTKKNSRSINMCSKYCIIIIRRNNYHHKCTLSMLHIRLSPKGKFFMFTFLYPDYFLYLMDFNYSSPSLCREDITP